MKRLFGLILVLAASASPVLAATVTNGDDAPMVLIVTENGSRVEVAIDPGSTETLCETGCFVTLPNGDRIALDGGENVEIVNGSAIVK